MSKLVSVIVPVYNAENYLDECVNNVLNQTYDNIELILVDDGSKDKCAEMCDTYKSNSKIKVIHKENGGASSARNAGLKAASGDYILFLDSDDYWSDKNCVSLLMEKVQDDTDLVCFGFKKYVEKTGETIDQFSWPDLDLGKDVEKDLAYLVEKGIYISSACTKLVRREFLLENNILFKERVTSEDIEWSARVLANCKNVKCLNNSLYIYRQRETSVTFTMSLKSISQMKDNIERSYKYAKDNIEIDSQRYKTYMDYMAYQYMTFLLSSFNVHDKEVKKIVKSLKYMADILKYSNNKKVVAMRAVYKVLGFNGLYFACKMYMKLLFNRI